ncbi:MAG: hypothetical protein RBS56_03685 [Candidatus Gracilibacteria bacterium]|jgi:hypothetical protein|nr:hypothetical protein [Candidatus Gracilibacteria bacterium]
MEGNNTLISSKVKLWSVLCYIPFANLIFCVLSSVKYADIESIRFHLRQGLVLFVLLFLSLFIILVSYVFGLVLFFSLIIYHIIGVLALLTDTFLILPGVGQVAGKIPEFFLYRLLTGKDPSETWVSKE